MQLESTIIVNSSVATVFTCLTSPDLLIQWQTYLSAAEQLTKGDIQVGSKFRNVLSHPSFNGVSPLTLDMEGEVIAFELNRRLGIRGTTRIGQVTIEYTLQEDDDQTIVRQSSNIAFNSLLILPIANVLKDFLTKQFQQDLVNLKELAESLPTAS